MMTQGLFGMSLKIFLENTRMNVVIWYVTRVIKIIEEFRLNNYNIKLIILFAYNVLPLISSSHCEHCEILLLNYYK